VLLSGCGDGIDPRAFYSFLSSGFSTSLYASIDFIVSFVRQFSERRLFICIPLKSKDLEYLGTTSAKYGRIRYRQVRTLCSGFARPHDASMNSQSCFNVLLVS